MAGAGAIATHIVRRGIQVNMRSSWRCILSDARTPSKAAAANCRLRWSESCEQRACVLAFYCMNAAEYVASVGGARGAAQSRA